MLKASPDGVKDRVRVCNDFTGIFAAEWSGEGEEMASARPGYEFTFLKNFATEGPESNSGDGGRIIKCASRIRHDGKAGAAEAGGYVVRETGAEKQRRGSGMAQLP